MKKIRSILTIGEDEVACFLCTKVVEEMQVAEYVCYFVDEQEALDFLKKQYGSGSSEEMCGFDLVFLDLKLKLLNAFGFLDHLKYWLDLNFDNLVIVVITAYWRLEDLEETKGYKIHGYVQKPLDKENVGDLFKRIPAAPEKGMKKTGA